MPMHNTWLIENEVAFTRIFGAISSSDEIRSPMFDIKEMLETSPRSLVHIIVDITGLEKTLPMAQSVQVTREVGVTSNLGWVLIVGARTPLIKFAVNATASLFQRRLRNFDTHEEALDFLNRMDTNLSQNITSLKLETLNG